MNSQELKNKELTEKELEKISGGEATISVDPNQTNCVWPGGYMPNESTKPQTCENCIHFFSGTCIAWLG